MGLSLEERIRQRAYEIWEQEGRPDGRDREHWLRAEAEITAEKRPGPVPISAKGQSQRGKANGRKAKG